jgi:hypothetical protein
MLRPEGVLDIAPCQFDLVGILASGMRHEVSLRPPHKCRGVGGQPKNDFPPTPTSAFRIAALLPNDLSQGPLRSPVSGAFDDALAVRQPRSRRYRPGQVLYDFCALLLFAEESGAASHDRIRRLWV